MKKKNHIKMRFSTLLLCCLAIVLCTAPCGAEIVADVASGDILNVGTDMGVERIENYWLHVLGTMNLYPGAYVGCIIYVHNGGTINIYGGELGTGYSIMLLGDNSTAVVTVYGTDFAVDDELLDTSATQFTVHPFNGGVLTGTYKNGDSINLLFYSSVPIHLKALDDEVEIDIDIKPGGNPNNINLKSRGVVPVAVLTTDDFDASTIDPDPDTLKFAGASPVRWKLCDVDGDGDKDMLFHFKTQYLELDADSTEATLTGKTKDEVEISGTDTVCIKPQKKKK